MNDIYIGTRGTKFTRFLQQILSLSRLNEEYYKVLLDEEGVTLYSKAFTHKTAHDIDNYEYLEFLGDTTLNKCIAWYLSDRFPQLKCAQGVKILTRLKINLISKRSFAGFAKQLHFWEFISADSETRNLRMEKTLEDVFEAFFGTTELLLDERTHHGVGYIICYNIIKTLLDMKEISLQYEDLFDAKTRLKEIFDHFGPEIGTLQYKVEKIDRIHHVSIFINDNICIGTGSAPLKADAQQYASTEAIASLKKMGFIKPISESYVKFCV